MKSKYSLGAISLIVSLVLLIPAASAGAAALAATPAIDPPPADMFQLPWEQGAAWVAIDGLDNGTNRPLNGSHYFASGGAVDFAPHNHMLLGEDTSHAWVVAAAAGTVIETSSCHLKIDHGSGWVTEYQFVGNLQVKPGDHVNQNQRLAVVADGIRLKFCPPIGDILDQPHLHFMLRPSIRNAAFSGWLIGYNPLFNATTFTKGDQSFSLFRPILNVPGSGPGPTPTPGPTSTPGSGERGAIAWDTIYSGNLDDSERWTLTLTEDTYFTMGAIPTTPGLTPVMLLLNASGEEEIRTTSLLSTIKPAGVYTVVVQAEGGSGSYQMLFQKNGYGSNIPDGPSTSTIVSMSPGVGESSMVTLNLNNIPAEGYTSAEFTCTYNPTVAEASNIAATSLFGADAAVAINGPQNGTFIIAVAGSNGNRAFGTGPIIRDAAITFSLKGLQAGWTLVTCMARVSTGNNTLVAIPFTPAGLAVRPVGPPQTSTPTPTPAQGPTTTATPTPIFSPTPTSLPAGSGAVAGTISAIKPIGINLYNADHSLAGSVAANPDGSFTLVAPTGTYTVVATAAGFLGVQGTVTLTDGVAGTLPNASLAAGDIDNNNVIDQFDALTLGMNYNAAVPAAADLNGDGVINVLDLELLAGNYRKTGPLPW